MEKLWSCRQAPDFIRVRVRTGDLVWSLSNLQSDGRLLKVVADDGILLSHTTQCPPPPQW